MTDPLNFECIKLRNLLSEMELSEEHRETAAFLLANKTLKEYSDISGLSRSTVDSRYFRLQIKIKQCWEKKYGSYSTQVKRKVFNKKGKAILKLNTSGEIEGSYASMAEAEFDGYGTAYILKSIRSKEAYKGFIWRYAPDPPTAN